MTTALLPAPYRAELLSSAIAPSLVDYLVENGYFYELAGNYEVCQFLNHTMPRFSWKAIQQQRRGWVFRGLDPLSWDQMSWGCFKPDNPRSDPKKPGKLVKYDSPQGVKKRVFITPSPLLNWKSAYCNSKVSKILCEGFKKAASLVTHGYYAIGLDGIWTGVRKQPNGELELAPDLQLAAVPGTIFELCFDHDSKRSTARQVALAQVALGELLEQAGCHVKIIRLPGPEKGVDDFVAAHGIEAFEKLRQEAIALSTFKLELWDNALPDLTYQPALALKQRYLDAALPDKGLVIVKSPMGTGKTELLTRILKQVPSCLSLTHRVTLGRQAAERLDLLLYSDVDVRAQYARKIEITADSLYKVPTEHNRFHTVVIDEVEQVLSHVLYSSTCREQRVSILQKLAYFIRSADRVIALQAEISDAAVDYLKALRGNDQPYIITNDYEVEPRLVAWYTQATPEALKEELLRNLEAGQRVIVPCYSKEEAKKVEEAIAIRCPNLKVQLVHGDNSGDEDVIAFVANINERVNQIDVLIYTPSMATGVSIDTPRFDAVFAIFGSAEIHASELMQMMGRYRHHCPWHIWSARRGSGFIGSTDPDELIDREKTQAIRSGVLTEIDLQTGVEGGPHLQFWAQLRARLYASKRRQREVLAKLVHQAGHYLFELNEQAGPEIKALVTRARERVKRRKIDAVVAQPDITDKEAELLLNSRQNLSEGDRLKLHKWRLKTNYQAEVTPDLVEMDKDGRLLKGIIALEELLEPELALERDRKDWEVHKFHPDRRHRSLKRWYRERLGLKAYLEVNRDWCREDLESWGELIEKHTAEISSVLGLSIPPNSSENWILAQLLQQLGLKTRSRRTGGRGNQERVYSLDPEHFDFVMQTLERRRRSRETPMVVTPS